MDSRCRLLSITVTVFLICVLTSQKTQAFDHCNLIDDCNECLRNYSECAWCEDLEWAHPPCFVAGAWYLGNSTCKLETNFQSTVTVITNSELNDENQVTPTMFSINLRAKQPVSQIVKVRPAAGYPIDSYYLMDFSYSMKDDLENLRLLAGNLTEEFRRVSENFTIGFGTFIDKNVSPFSFMDAKRLNNPCYTDMPDILTGKRTSCPPSYSFRNEMSLQDSQEEFTETLNNLQVSSNIDSPEGGFEALLQVAACSSQIGFRKKSRKIVIYASDAGIHIAGDGKLAGLVLPNDGECDLGRDGYYKGAELQDYPTIEQVNQKLIRKNIIPIFAVETDYVNLYSKLSHYMSQLSQVGLLSRDSSNIVDLVREALHRITSTINLVVVDDLGYNIEVKPLCEHQVADGCSNVKHGQVVEFEVSFTLEQCDPDESKTWRIIPIIIPGFDIVYVNVTHQCQCHCNNNASESGSDVCSNHGDRVCGPCKCRYPYFGDDCECSPKNQKSEELCRSPVSKLICSRQGRCECGKCKCKHPQTPPGVQPPYIRYGEFCECSNYECPKGTNGKICNGQGNCHCGQCNCKESALGVPTLPTTEGEACDCELSTDKCYDPAPDVDSETSHLPCGGPEQGHCVCNRCSCKPNYRGRYCEQCIFCGPLRCSTHTRCVLCKSVKQRKAHASQTVDCSRACEGNGVLSYEVVGPAVNAVRLRNLGYDIEACGRNVDEEYSCSSTFYIVSANVTVENRLNITVYYDNDIECEELALVWIILLIVGAIVLLGLFILGFWKCWTLYTDKKLYAQFEDDMAAAKWNTTQSPIYKQPTTRHANPLFSNE